MSADGTGRIAIARGSQEDVAQYLPSNYTVIGPNGDGDGVIIGGVDNAGWTLHDYVIPRLGSALIFCEEMSITAWKPQ